MPGLPLPPRDAGDVERDYPESHDQICHQLSNASLSEAEQVIAEDNFGALYCKPVELYNIIQRRSIRNPFYMQRSLRYKLDAKRKNRIEITLSLSESTNTNLHAQSIFPLYVLLARPTSNVSLDGHSPIYRFNRVCLLPSFSDCENKDNAEATFIIPDVNNLSTSDSCNLEIIFISSGNVGQTICEDKCPRNHVDLSSLQNLGGKCSWGKIPINLLTPSLENCVNLSFGHTAEFASAVTMSPSFLESKFLEHDSCLTFCSHEVDGSESYQVQVCISAQEVGARAMLLSPYNSYTYDDIPLSSVSHIRSDISVVNSLRDGNVIFNYKYYNNKMQKTEVTEDFSCPFCLVRCGSFKGMRCHLNSSHDIFHFEFWVSGNCQAVNVSLKTDVWRDECVAAGVDPRNQTFTYISKLKRCRRLKTTTENTRQLHSQIMASGSPEDVQVASEDENVQRENGTSVEHSSIDPTHSVHGSSSLSQPTVLQFGKTRKLSAERADPRNRQLLQKRQFFHSHRAQPMASDQVFSERDSEDEVDDDVTDFEDRRMLDDFVDVTKDEKLLMHMWNSFVRKQRVLADGHVPWACEAFSQLHGKQLVQNPSLRWGWRMFIIKLWNHGLLDARTMNRCNMFLDGLQDESSDPKQF